MTVYHEEVPSNYRTRFCGRKRRGCPRGIEHKNFASERDVVKEEYRQRIRANPYGEFYLNIRLCRAVIVCSLCF